MRIRSVHSAAVVNPQPLGRSHQVDADWHDAIDHMNPLADDPLFVGQAQRFTPPWSEAICLVTADDGQFGIGLTGLAGTVVPVINDYLGPMLTGEPTDEPERLWAMMSAATGAYFGRGAVAGYALSAVDLALWDLYGKLVGEPVWRLLGGDKNRPPVDCYATGLSVDDHLASGFESFKLACPWGPPESNPLHRLVDLVEQTRRMIGPERTLMLDCWMVNRPEDAVAVAVAPYGQHLSSGLQENRWAEMYIGARPGASLMDSYRATPGMALPVDWAIRPTDSPGFGIELTAVDVDHIVGEM